MGYTVLGHGTCADCSGSTVQLAVDTDVDGNDDYAGVGWFHVVGRGEVAELCPLQEKSHEIQSPSNH
jgi:hypothetical protein